MREGIWTRGGPTRALPVSRGPVLRRRGMVSAYRGRRIFLASILQTCRLPGWGTQLSDPPFALLNQAWRAEAPADVQCKDCSMAKPDSPLRLQSL